MPLNLVQGPVISAGNSLSNMANISNVGSQQLVGVIMPDSWDQAEITFQWSLDNKNYYDLFKRDGTEVSFVFVPSAVVPLSSEYYPQIVPYLKIRSGNRVRPINQTADRKFQLLVQ